MKKDRLDDFLKSLSYLCIPRLGCETVGATPPLEAVRMQEQLN